MLIESHDTACDQPLVPGNRELAIEARFILSAMEAAGPMAVERRRTARVRYCVEASLRLATDDPDDPPRQVYTRDLTPHGLGFISSGPLPLGSGATLHLPAPGGGVDTIACNVIRCREILWGWFEGAIAFKEETPKPLHTAELDYTALDEVSSSKRRYQAGQIVNSDICI